MERREMAVLIRIQLIGAQSDNKDVRLSELISQLDAVKAALRESEEFVNPSVSKTLDYKVVDLRHSSPATIVVEPIPDVQHPTFYADRVLRTFTTELRTIRTRKRLLGAPQMSRLAAYGQIGASPQRKLEQVNNALEDRLTKKPTREVPIDKKFKENLQEIVGPDEIVYGSISGRLEYVNLHNVKKFRLYPDLGPKRIDGTFTEKARADVRNAIDRFVTVFGKLKFKTWDRYPYEVSAEHIQ